MDTLIGVVPSVDSTFEIYGDTSVQNPIEGKLYYDPVDKRLYYYSLSCTRSSPTNGYFPIWDGKSKIITPFSKEKYLDKDAIMTDMNSINKAVSSELAESIRYQQRKSCSSDILNPVIVDGDNMFTQCVKGVVSAMEITMIDLADMAAPKISSKIIENYYAALNKITFMRYDKWTIWVNSILHINYRMTVNKDGKKILLYEYPRNVFDTGIVNYDKIINNEDDPFKKIVKLLMIIENITKSSLREDQTDDYTINNMMTTLNSNKPLSAQLFSRFIRMAKLSCHMEIFKNDKLLFSYKE